MRRSNGLLGLIGIILLLFAGVAAFLTRGRSPFDLLYIGSHGLVGLFALIAYLSSGLDNLREFVGERSTKYGANTIVSSLLFIVILVAVNYILARNHHKFDLTEAHVFSLSPQSISVVKNLQNDLAIQAFVEGGINPELRDLLTSYADQSSKIKFEMIDPDRQPEQAEKYKVSAYNTIRLEYGNETTTISQPNEENLTNAIIKVTRTTHKTVCMIEGHGEPDIDNAEDAKGFSALKADLANENYEVTKTLLATIDKMPDDCSVVVVVATARPYTDHEIDAIGAYLKKGGRVLFMIPPRINNQFAALLGEWGLKLGNDVVVDQVVRLFQGPALGLAPLANTYAAHDITKDFKQRTIFPMARSVQMDAAGKKGLVVTELVKTSPSSWAESDLEALFQRSEASLDPATDRKGPVSVAAVVDGKLKEMGIGEGESRVAVFGSVEFADNRNIEGTYYNRDLLLNTIDWLVGQSDLVSVRTKTIRASRVQFTQDQGTVIFYLSVLVIPELLLMAGLVVWWRRE
ncbi:MAG: GldG family protein [Deltaproteobacteria bacterium]|nr:GldG family protein [Deltaproteobacteria bacterium]MBI3391338.1 GldG family protein [Deltaproteobacteria bacterium]